MRQTMPRPASNTLVLFMAAVVVLAVAAPGSAVPGGEVDSERHIVKVVGHDPGVVWVGRHGEHSDPRCFFLGTGHRRGVLGVELIRLTPELRHHFGAPEDAGVMVAKVLPDSPAEEAGLEVGDVLSAVDGQEISTPVQVTRLVRPKRESEPVQLVVWREGQPRSLEAIIAERQGVAVDLGGALFERCKEFDIEVDTEAIHEALERTRSHFQNPEWLTRWRLLEGVEVEQMEERVRELEERLKELEQKLKAKSDAD